MTSYAWLQLGVLVAILLVTTRVLGAYIAGVFGGGKAMGDRVFLPVERALYRVCGVDPTREQTWPVYAFALLAFSMVSVLGLYLLQRIQGYLPLNPTDAKAVPPALAFNTAVSFVTNTNWQNYGGELTMSHLTQMAGLTVQNFVSAAVGLAVAVALIRGFVRRRSATIGNFWVDLTRGTIRVLLPLSIVIAIVLASQGVVQNLHGFTHATTVQGATQSIPGGPIASQEAIKELGENGGGPFNANSAHPFENANGFTNLFEILVLLMIPFALTYTYGRLVKDQKQGWVLFAVDVLDLDRRGRPRDALRGRRQPEARRRSAPSAATWRARRCASAPRCRGCSRPRRPAPRPAPSTPPTTASRRSAAPCRSST